MSTEQVRVHFAVTSNMSPFIKQVNAANAAVARFNTTSGAMGNNFIPKVLFNEFSQTLGQAGHFNQKMVKARSEADKFSESLTKGKLGVRDSVAALRDMRNELGVINQLANKQVRLQQSVATALGTDRTGAGRAMVFTPSELDMKTASTRAAYLAERMRIVNQTITAGSQAMIDWGKNTQWAGRQMMVGLTIPLTLLAGAASMAFNTMDRELVRIQKVYGSGLQIGEQFKKERLMIREEAIALSRELAQAYGQSYDQTLKLTADIASTGKEGAELMDSVRETSRLATLGEIDRNEAMKATLSMQTAFRMDTEELTKSINFLNAVENETSATLQDLTEAIPRAGSTVQSLGGNIQDLALYMTAMREGGVEAGEAANALKSGLAAIIAPSKVASDYVAQFGINLEQIVQTNEGDLTGTLIALQDAFEVLSDLEKQQAMAKLFGRYQMNRMAILFSNLGSEGSQTAQVLDLMNMSAEDLAATAEDELATAMESASGKFKIALETLKQSLAIMGEDFLGTFTKGLEVISKIIDGFNNLNGAVKTGIKWGAIIAAVIGPIIMTVGVFANFLGYVVKLGNAFRMFATNRGLGRFKALSEEMSAAKAIAEQMAQPFDRLNTTMQQLVRSVSDFKAGLSSASAVAPALQKPTQALMSKLLPANPNAGLAGVVLGAAPQNASRSANNWTLQNVQARGGLNVASMGLTSSLVSAMNDPANSQLKSQLIALGQAASNSTLDINQLSQHLENMMQTVQQGDMKFDMLNDELAQTSNLHNHAQSVLAKWSAAGMFERGGGSKEAVRGANILAQEMIKRSVLSGSGPMIPGLNINELREFGITDPSGQKIDRSRITTGTKGSSLSIYDVLHGGRISVSGSPEYTSSNILPGQAEHALSQDAIRNAQKYGLSVPADITTQQGLQDKMTGTLSALINQLISMSGGINNAIPVIQQFGASLGLTPAEIQQFVASIQGATVANQQSAAAQQSWQQKEIDRNWRVQDAKEKIATAENKLRIKQMQEDRTTYADAQRRIDKKLKKMPTEADLLSKAQRVGGKQYKTLESAISGLSARKTKTPEIQSFLNDWGKGGKKAKFFVGLVNAAQKLDTKIGKIDAELANAAGDIQKFGNSFQSATSSQLKVEADKARQELLRARALSAKQINQPTPPTQYPDFDFDPFSKKARQDRVRADIEAAKAARMVAKQDAEAARLALLNNKNRAKSVMLLNQYVAARNAEIAASLNLKNRLQVVSIKLSSAGELAARFMVGGALTLSSAMKKASQSIISAASMVKNTMQKHSMGAGMALSSLSMVSMFTGQADGTGTGATAINAATMAGMGAGVGMMFGPQAALIGALAGGAFGAFQKISEASKKAVESAQELATNLSKASSKASEALLRLAGVTEDQIEQQKSSMLEAGTRAFGVPIISSGLDQKVLDQEKERIEAFSKLSSDQAMLAAVSLYEQLVFGGSTKGAAKALVDSVIRQANKSEVLIDVSAKIELLDESGSEFDIGRMIEGQIKAQIPAIEQGLASMSGKFPWQADFLKGGKLGSLSEEAKSLIQPFSQSIADSVALGFQNGIRKGVISYENDNIVSSFMEISGESVSSAISESFGDIEFDQRLLDSDILRQANEILGGGVTTENFWEKYFSVPSDLQGQVDNLMQAFDKYGERRAVASRLREDQVEAFLSSMSEEQAAYIEALAAPFQEGVNSLDRFNAIALAASVTFSESTALAIANVSQQLANGADRATTFARAIDNAASDEVRMGLILFESEMAHAASQVNDLYNKLGKPQNINIDSTSAALAEARLSGVIVELQDLENFAATGIDVSVQIRARIAEQTVVSADEIAEKNREIAESLKAQADATEAIDEIEEGYSDLEESVDDLSEAEKKASEDRIKTLEKYSQEYLDNLQKQVQDRISFVQKAIDAENELRKEQFDKEMDALREANDAKQEAAQKEIDSVANAYDQKIEAIRNEQDARDKALKQEEKRLQREQQIRDLRLRMMQGVASGDAFAVLGAQLEMKSSQEKWVKEDQEEVEKDRVEKALQQIEDEKSARIAAMEEAAQRQKEIDDENFNRQQEYGQALLEAQRERDAERLAQYQESQNEFLEQEREAQANKLEYIRELENKALEDAKAARQADLEDKRAVVDQEIQSQKVLNAQKEFWAGQQIILQQDILDKIINQNMSIQGLAEQYQVSYDQMVANIQNALGTTESLMLTQKNLAQVALESSRLLGLVASGSMTEAEAKTALDKFVRSKHMEEGLESAKRRESSIAYRESKNPAPVKRSSGGPVFGPGTSTSDSIPALLSNGEFVMSAAAVNKYGLAYMHAINARKFANGGAALTSTMIDEKAAELAKKLGLARVNADDAASLSDNQLANQKLSNLQSEIDLYNSLTSEKIHSINALYKLNTDSMSSMLKLNQDAYNEKTKTMSAFSSEYLKATEMMTSESISSENMITSAIKDRTEKSKQYLDDILGKNTNVTNTAKDQWTSWKDAAVLNILGTGNALIDTFTNINYEAMVKMVEAYAGGRQDEGDKLKGEVLKRSQGGPVFGAGTATSDSIPALLSNGEFVMRASAVDKYGLGVMEQINAGRFAEGGIVGNLVQAIGTQLKDVFQEKIQNAINARAYQFSVDENGEIVDWSKIPKESYGYPFSGGTTYSGGNHGPDGLGAIDFGRPQAPFGAPIRPAGPGYAVVRNTNSPDTGNPNDGGGGGNWMYVNHVIDGKPYTSVYMHMKQGSAKVKSGDLVTRSTILGEVGASGHVIPAGIAGSHLHFEFGSGHGSVGKQQTRTLFPPVANAYNAAKGFPLVMGGPGLLSFVAPGVSRYGLGADSMKFNALQAGQTGEIPSGTSLDMSDASIPGISANVSRWSNVVRAAMKALGIPDQYLIGILRQMQQESSGNPNAINDWDSNAAKGIPSRGLMQTILPTFMKYAPPGKNTPEFHTDPYANIYAGINYAKQTYGIGKFGLWNAGFNQAYSRGGLVIPALRRGATVNYDNTLANLHRGETVLTAPLTQKLKENLDVASGGENHYTINVNVNEANASARDIERAVMGALEMSERRMGRVRKIGGGR